MAILLQDLLLLGACAILLWLSAKNIRTALKTSLSTFARVSKEKEVRLWLQGEMEKQQAKANQINEQIKVYQAAEARTVEVMKNLSLHVHGVATLHEDFEKHIHQCIEKHGQLDFSQLTNLAINNHNGHKQVKEAFQHIFRMPLEEYRKVNKLVK